VRLKKKHKTLDLLQIDYFCYHHTHIDHKKIPRFLMATSHKGEGYMSRFRLPLYLQALCDEVPDREFLGSSARIRKDRKPSMAKLIAKAKLALKSKPSSSRVRPCLSQEEIDAIWAQGRRCKAQQHVTQQQRFMLDQVDQQHATQQVTQQHVTQQQRFMLDQFDQQHATEQQVTPQQHHPYFATTTSEITEDSHLANFKPSLGWSEYLKLYEDAPTQWHREDTPEERRGSNKRIKLAAMG
jgi:hypothetical protein